MRCRKHFVALRIARGHKTSSYQTQTLLVKGNVWLHVWFKKVDRVISSYVSLHYVYGFEYFIFKSVMYLNERL